MGRTAVLSYSRMPEDSLYELRDGLSELNIGIAVITSHVGEELAIQRVFPNVVHYPWGAYSYDIPWVEPFDHELYENLLAPRKATALPLFERYGPFEGGSMEAETRAAHDFSRAQQIIEKHSPDLVLFAKQPENGLEYMLYILARHHGIQTLMTRSGAFGHSRTVSTTLEDPILTADWKPHPSTVPICNLQGPGTQLHPKTQEEINRVRSLGNDYRPGYMLDKTDGRQWRDTLKALFAQSTSPKHMLRFLLHHADGPIFKKRLFDRYMCLATAEIDMSASTTVFFPLHYQPELTTMPLGGAFVNQIKAIKLLSDALPADGRIYVKEHLSIFATGTKGSRNFRPKNYYRWLVSIPKVSLVRPELPSAYLQDAADFTACITGTAGLEAMLRGYKVLAFGNASYLNGPGVHSVMHQPLSTILVDSRGGEKGAADEFVQALDSVSLHVSDIPPNEQLRTMQRFYMTALLAGVAELSKINLEKPSKKGRSVNGNSV